MKNLLFLLLFIPLVSFGQEEVTVIQSKTSVSSSTNIENELVLSDEKTTIKTPLTADLSNYTHLLLVDASSGETGNYRDIWSESRVHRAIKSVLGLSVFEVINPYDFDKKRFRKNPTFLKTIKNESYLYLYFKEGKGRGDDTNATIIIRDWKNKQIYNATHINTGLNEILAPLIDY